MKTLISIDPGMSTGVAVGTFSESEPYQLRYVFQIEGGVEGFVEKVYTSNLEHDDLTCSERFSIRSVSGGMPHSWTLWEEEHVGCEWGYDEACEDDERNERHKCASIEYFERAVIVAEKFTARGSGNKFSYRTDALEPLRVEGALLAMELKPVWQAPQRMYFMLPQGFKGNKKSAMHKWLKENDLYVTGKDVGCEDADDARSAIVHAIAYLRSIKHMPTMKKYFGGEDEQ